MNILIVSQYFYPEQFQINEIAPELVKRGHNVTVLTGLPNYPQGEIYDGYQGYKHKDEYIDGIHVIRVKEHPRKHSVIHLLWNYYSFYFHGTQAVKQLKDNFDIVFIYQLSPVTMAIPGLRFAAQKGIPVFLYCLDLWPESAQAHVKSDKGLLYRYISGLSKKIYTKCNRIAVTSRPFISYLHNKNNVPEERMNYIPQHADDSYLVTDLTSQEDGIADFMYAGNLGQGQIVETIIYAAECLKHHGNFKIHIVGDGSCRSNLESMVKKKGLSDTIFFYGNQKRDDMIAFYRKADALLITLRGNNFVGNTVPGKLQVYMTTGKPIFGAINGAAKDIIKESGCGAAVGAGDYAGLAQIMADYIDHPTKYAACGENGKKYFTEHFTLEKYMDSLEKVLNETVKSWSDDLRGNESCSLKN